MTTPSITPRAAPQEKSAWRIGATQRALTWFAGRRRTFRAVGMIASASFAATALAVIGSLVQARFISPQDLGFVRKYAVISGYAIFLSLGMFDILHKEYPVLIGRGDTEGARRTAALVQSWCLLSSIAVCGVLALLAAWELSHGHLREAAAWFIQIVAVASALYVGYLTCSFRSGQDFERLAKGQFLSSIAGTLVLPVFVVLPFLALVLRSVAGSIVSGAYLHRVRPVRTGWYLPWRPLFQLARRGLRLYAGTYLRYGFWLTVEIWLLVRFGGDTAVGLFVFASMVAESTLHLTTAVNQVFMPRLAQSYGSTGSLAFCLKQGRGPTLVTLLTAIAVTALIWYVLPPVIAYAFPKYLASVPLIRILVLQIFIVALSLPVYMVTILESYVTQLVAAILGLAVLVVTAFLLNSRGAAETAVAWGTIAGQAVFVLACLLSVFWKAKVEDRSRGVGAPSSHAG